MRDRIIELYGEKRLRKSAMRIREGAGAFARTMAGKGYRTGLEIGTYRGVSAAEMSQYCDRVVTIDLIRGQLEEHSEKRDRDAFWKSLGIDTVELRLVRDNVEKAEVIAGLDFDFSFIDGAHDEASVRNDFEMVRRCGNVLFHDYVNEPGNDDVFRFVNTLPKDQVETFDIFAMWTAPK